MNAARDRTESRTESRIETPVQLAQNSSAQIVQMIPAMQLRTSAYQAGGQTFTFILKLLFCSAFRP